MTLTVIDTSETSRLTTVAMVRALCGEDLPAEDEAIETLIDQASAAIVSQCGRTFASERISETFRGAPSVLMLSRWPVTDVTSVVAAGSLIPPQGYELDAGGGLVYRLAGERIIAWPASLITVEYIAGYALPGDANPTLPADVERAALLLVRNAWMARGQNPFIRSDVVEDVGSRTYGLPNAFPAEIAELLAPWRVPQVL